MLKVSGLNQFWVNHAITGYPFQNQNKNYFARMRLEIRSCHFQKQNSENCLQNIEDWFLPTQKEEETEQLHMPTKTTQSLGMF